MLATLAFSLPAALALHAPSPPALHSGNGLHPAVCSAGDVDGDGIPDIHVAGRPSGTEGGQPFVGIETQRSIWTFSGADGSVILRHDLIGPDGGDAWQDPGRDVVFGVDLANAGDIDGDGTPDLLASGKDRGNQYSNLVEIRSGRTGETLRRVSTDELEGALRTHQIETVAGGTDLDGDGTPDVLLGAPGKGPALYAISGRTWQPIFDWTKENTCDTHGDFVGFLPPIKAGGPARVIVGASGHGISGYESRYTVLAHTGKEFEGSRGGDGVGWQARGLGDLSGDGIPELLMSDCHYGVVALNGATYEPIWLMTSGRGKENNEGYSITVLDADSGLIAVGANELIHWGLAVESDRGSVKIIRVGDDEPTWSMDAPLWGGFDVASAGDVNGDGHADLALVERRTQRVEIRSGADPDLVLWNVALGPLAESRDAELFSKPREH